MTATWRATRKADRRAALMTSAARLFAERGFAAVSTAELGQAVGVSGPALYKHFASKDALLAAILVDASERLLEGCHAILRGDADTEEDTAGSGRDSAHRSGHASGDDEATLSRLIRFHLEFATADPDIIRIQDRELPSLAEDANHRVRRLQREYVQSWDGVLARLRRDLDGDERRTRLEATFGLLNSTPHSARSTGDRAVAILAGMAHRALVG